MSKQLEPERRQRAQPGQTQHPLLGPCPLFAWIEPALCGAETCALFAVWQGTLVVGGKGTGVVINTGRCTEIGKIATDLHQEDDKTPLQKKLDEVPLFASFCHPLLCSLPIRNAWLVSSVLTLLGCLLSTFLRAPHFVYRLSCEAVCAQWFRTGDLL